MYYNNLPHFVDACKPSELGNCFIYSFINTDAFDLCTHNTAIHQLYRHMTFDLLNCKFLTKSKFVYSKLQNYQEAPKLLLWQETFPTGQARSPSVSCNLVWGKNSSTW